MNRYTSEAVIKEIQCFSDSVLLLELEQEPSFQLSNLKSILKIVEEYRRELEKAEKTERRRQYFKLI